MTSARCAGAGRVSRGATLGRPPAERPGIEPRPRRFVLKAAIPDRDGARQEGDPCQS